MGERRVLQALVAAGTFAAATAAARSRRVSAAEERVFRRLNSAPDGLHLVLWPVMQMGSLGAAFVAAAIVRRRDGTARPAVIVACAGSGVWAAVKVVKPLVGRGRPEQHLERVHVRGADQSGLGFPSGHAAVSMTIALLATRPGRPRRLAVGAAVVTALSRVYVAAHLPLDVVAGAAAGWLVGLACSPHGRS